VMGHEQHLSPQVRLRATVAATARSSVTVMVTAARGRGTCRASRAHRLRRAAPASELSTPPGETPEATKGMDGGPRA